MAFSIGMVNISLRELMFRQNDIVRLKDEKRVKYVSGPKGRSATPKGDWIVVGSIGADLILARDNTIIRIPMVDVVLVAAYSMEKILKAVDDAKPVF
jgi:hypothetical protein